VRRIVPVAATAAALLIFTTAAYAQAAIGGGGGGGLGDAIVQWFYTSFIHALAAAGLLALLVGALVMRSHMMQFMIAAVALLCLGNYTTILGLFGL
jgi:hypothetical protein